LRSRRELSLGREGLRLCSHLSEPARALRSLPPNQVSRLLRHANLCVTAAV
jgi:hypothetical protein